MSNAPQVAADAVPLATHEAASSDTARWNPLLRPMLPGYVLLALFAAACFGSYWYISRPDYRFRQAWRALEAADYDQARHEAARLSGTPGFKPHARLLEAAVVVRSQAYNKNSNAQSLVKTLQQAFEHPDTRPLSLLVLGEVLTKAGAFSEARQVLLRATSEGPQQTQAYILLAWLSYDLGALGDALDSLFRAATLDPLNPRPHRLMAYIRFNQGRSDEAAAHYRESLRRSRLQPDMEEILLELADCEVKNRNYDEALRLLDEEVERDSAQKFVLRALCHHGLAHVDRASADVKRALQKDPFNVRALSLKGTIAMEAGDHETARQALTQAIDTNPAAVEPRNKLRTLYQQTGQTALAQRETLEISRLQKASSTIDTLLQRAWKAASDPEIRYQLGVQYRDLGRQSEAARWFQMAITLDPAHQPAQKALQEIEKVLAPGLATSARPTP